ncbi:hypothetical protein B0H14DRAFT_3491316 [Mycena olivaceomarginata]|nr:hypothetical protein B0H14DRAFT_3491316 [Mycena olivaceomarginata]
MSFCSSRFTGEVMLWIPTERRTRSGTIFASFLESQSFDFTPLIQASTRLQLSGGEHDTDDVEDYPTENEETTSPHDLDATNLHPDLDEPVPPLPKRPRLSMADRIATEDPPLSPRRPPARHRRRCEKRNAKIAEEGQKARPATIRAHVYTDTAIPTPLRTEDLPAAHGGYTAKPGTPYAAKKRWTLLQGWRAWP